MLKSLSVILSISIAFNAVADDTAKTMTCPSVTRDASSIINSIQSLKNQIKPIPTCQPIEQKISTVSEIIIGKPWNLIKNTIEKGENFEGQDLKKIEEITEKASIALNDIIGQITNNPDCIDEKNQASFMSKLSGVVKEVSGVIGSVSGPYGIAVSMGGSLLSSAIKGIDKFYKAKHPYQFSNPDEEMLFMNQFCSYVEIQKDINDYLNLDVRPEELNSLENYLKIKEKDLIENCPECNALSIAWKTQGSAGNILNRIIEDANIIEAGNDDTHNNYTRCNEINRAVHTKDSDLNQFFGLLDNYKNPMSTNSDLSLIKDIVTSSKELSTIYPKLTTCWSLDSRSKQRKSQDFNNFLRDDILPLGETIFGQQVKTFKNLANRKFANPLGDYTENTLNRRLWISAEKERVKAKLNESNYGSSAQLIITHKKALEERIFDELMVDYLKFLKKRNVKQISDFIYDYQKFSRKTIREYSLLLKKRLTSVNQVQIELEKSSNIDKRPFLSLLKDQKTNLDLAIAQTETLDRYCHFMNYMLLTTKQTKNTCADAKKDLAAKYNEVASIDLFTQDYVSQKQTWLSNNGNYQSSRIKDYSIHLRDWLDRGSERWELKQE